MINKTSAMVARDYQLEASFGAVRQKLLSAELGDRWQEALAYWARTTDRHLPIALMQQCLRTIVDTPFSKLAATPGIGPKKLNSLIMLLERAATGESAGGAAAGEAPVAVPRSEHNGDGSSCDVSEAVWRQWRASLQQHGLGREMLGRFAASLQQLPRAMWQKRLDFYLPLSLDEIRCLKAYGEKRVAALVEIFGDLHRIIDTFQGCPHIAVRVEPRLAARLDDWCKRQLCSESRPDEAAVKRALLEPLVEQISIDLGDDAAGIVRARLSGAGLKMQQIARQFGLTRGRAYEVLSEAATVIWIRWPQGHERVTKLHRHLAASAAQGAALSPVESLLNLLFSQRPREFETELAPPLGLPLTGYNSLSPAAVGAAQDGLFALAQIER
ncbi:MAG TPA: hypothetical protein VNH11_13210 [Pirellulales bacterium]|nr:hypothetical protein [Pirellulales bacterium]